MRLNVGIRRRLAPLLDSSREETELLQALLFSLPGSPVLYYGDEIGMGDNIQLEDRDGVRTPMQWTYGPNAGFSDAARLYLPVVDDPTFGPQAVNVEAELNAPDSLLHWLRGLIALRRANPVFGLGSFEPLDHDVPAVFAHIRRLDGDIVVCAHNLSRSQQTVDVDLSEFGSLVPEDLVTGERLALCAHARPAWVSLAPPCRRGPDRRPASGHLTHRACASNCSLVRTCRTSSTCLGACRSRNGTSRTSSRCRAGSIATSFASSSTTRRSSR